jgi:exopolyphosphatase/guanosine-5'-triphosphate,3'-diphosphate pyrophosphatase
VRRAGNRAALAELIARSCDGLAMETLSDEQEARLAFTGAAWAARPEPGARLAVVDAGGGSTEIVVAAVEAGYRPRDIWWESIPIGSSDVSTRWLRSDPPTPEEFAAARAGVQAHFAHVDAPPHVGRAIAVGGSATSLRGIAGDVLEPGRLEILAEQAASLAVAELADRFSVDAQRAGLVVGGLLILQAACAVLGTALEVGGGGLREGVLLSDDGEESRTLKTTARV